MFSIVKTTLAAVIVLGSVALPADAARYASGSRGHHAVQSRDVALPRGGYGYGGYVPYEQQQWPDRNTASFGGGI
jgi:hypothetical protein